MAGIEALAAGKHPGVAPVLLQVRERLVGGMRARRIRRLRGSRGQPPAGCGEWSTRHLSGGHALGDRDLMPFYVRRVTSCYNAAMTQRASSSLRAPPPAWAQQKLLLPLGGEPLVRARRPTRLRRRVRRSTRGRGLPARRRFAALDGLPVPSCGQPRPRQRHGQLVPRCRRASPGEAARRCSRWQTSPSSRLADYRHLRRHLTRAARASSASRFGEVTAPPHLFAREFFPELAALEHGARPVLQRHADRMVDRCSFRRTCCSDIDTPDDYERAKARCRRDDEGWSRGR